MLRERCQSFFENSIVLPKNGQLQHQLSSLFVLLGIEQHFHHLSEIFPVKYFSGHFVDPCLYFSDLFMVNSLHKCSFLNKIGDQSILSLIAPPLRRRIRMGIIDIWPWEIFGQMLMFFQYCHRSYFQKTPFIVTHGLQDFIQSFFYSLRGPSFDLDQHLFMDILPSNESSACLFPGITRFPYVPVLYTDWLLQDAGQWTDNWEETAVLCWGTSFSFFGFFSSVSSEDQKG